MTADLQADLTPAEQEKLATTLADLHAHGYRDIEQHEALRVGARIRHRGQRWSEAYEHGTGVVLALTERNPSSWSQSWNMADVELVALWGEPSFGGRLSQVAQYHVEAVGGVE